MKSATDAHKARTGFLDEIELVKLTGAAGYLSDIPLYLIENVRTLKDIENTIHEFIQKKNMKVVFLDHLQYIQSERFNSFNKKNLKWMN